MSVADIHEHAVIMALQAWDRVERLHVGGDRAARREAFAVAVRERRADGADRGGRDRRAMSVRIVLVFHRSRAAILEREVFSGDQRDLAWDAHDRLVRKHLGAAEVEVVLLGAASETVLRATHGRYFRPVVRAAQIVGAR